MPLIGILLLALTGCIRERPELHVACPTLVRYERAWQQQAAVELDRYGPDAPHVRKMISDYIALRDACRALARR